MKRYCFLRNVNIDSLLKRGWFFKVEIGNQILNFKVDAEAQVDVLSFRNLDKVNTKKIIRKASIKINNFNGRNIKVIGRCELKCTLEIGVIGNTDFVIVDEDSQPIIGLETINKLKLLKKIYTINRIT